MAVAVATAVVALLVFLGGVAFATGLLGPEAEPSPTPAPVVVTRTATPTGTATPAPTATPILTPTPATTPTPRVATTVTPNVRRMTSAELTLLLKAQVESQRAQFQDGRVRFVVPNLVVILGRAPVGGQLRQVEAYLQVGVQDGRARIVSQRIAVGNNQPAPPELQAALSARVAQTNRELELAVPSGQRVRRVYVTGDEIIGEMEAP
jgi:hypothetical protein